MSNLDKLYAELAAHVNSSNKARLCGDLSVEELRALNAEADRISDAIEQAELQASRDRSASYWASYVA